MTDVTATRILVDEDGRPRRRVRGYRLAIGGSTHEVAQPCLRIGSRPGNDVVVDDRAVSRVHLEILSDEHGHRLRDLESRNGTFLGGRRVRDAYLRPGDAIRVGQTEIVYSVSEREADVPASASERFGPLVGRSVAMRELFATLERAATADATVLIEGETGTGKELVARAIHERSPRRAGPFVVFDCAVVQPHLVDAELFGHEKGAFTGASERRAGRLEEADGGTLFIDELGELPLEMQPKLLRALERREVRRLGSSKNLPVDIRVVAATHRDLAAQINRGAFREDLYYRLAVVRVALAPLRDRPEDVRPLVEHLLRRECRDEPARADAILASISEANWERMEAHPWPGNVRQLRNLILRTLALSDGSGIAALDDARGPRPAAPRPAQTPSAGTPGVDLSRGFVDQKSDLIAWYERSYLEAQLAAHDGNISRAAAASGMDRMHFKRVLKKYR